MRAQGFRPGARASMAGGRDALVAGHRHRSLANALARDVETMTRKNRRLDGAAPFHGNARGWRFSRLVAARVAARVAQQSSSDSGPSGSGAEPGALLSVKDVHCAVASSGQEVLKGCTLEVGRGEVHAIMGTNGSGKSTLSKAIVGHPDYDVTGGTMTFKGQDLSVLEPEERALQGIFLSFQNPVELPGVNQLDFLRLAYNARKKSQGGQELDPIEFYSFVAPKLQALGMKMDFLNRNVNEGFSGGEKKRNEILQMAVLDCELCVLDEIDSGLDIDALKDVARAVNGIREDNPNITVVMITHYQRLLNMIKPDFVHIMKDGRITRTGTGMELVEELEASGYKNM